MKKKCSKCRAMKPLGQFYVNRATQDGKDPYCSECRRAYMAGYRKQNPAYLEWSREHNKRYYARHRLRIIRKSKRWYKEKGRALNLTLYGLDEPAYAKLLARQDGLCAICKKVGRGRLHVDHDHHTGKVRGLLCRSCNFGLGNFKDDCGLLRAAVGYLSVGGAH